MRTDADQCWPFTIHDEPVLPPLPMIDTAALGVNLRRLGALLGAPEKVRFIQATGVRGARFMRICERPALATRDEIEKIARFYGLKAAELSSRELTVQRLEMAEDWIKGSKAASARKHDANAARKNA